MRISSGQQPALAPRKCLDTTEEGGGDGRIHIDREVKREVRERKKEIVLERKNEEKKRKGDSEEQ